MKMSKKKKKEIILKIENLELWVWGRTVDYEGAALLPAACAQCNMKTQAQMVHRMRGREVVMHTGL